MRLITTHVDAAVDARALLRHPPPPSPTIPPSLAATTRLPPLKILRSGLEVGHAEEKGRGHQRPQDDVLHLFGRSTLLGRTLTFYVLESRPMHKNSLAPPLPRRRDCFSEPPPPTQLTPLYRPDALPHREGEGAPDRSREGREGGRSAGEVAVPRRRESLSVTAVNLNQCCRGLVGRRRRATADRGRAKTDEASDTAIPDPIAGIVIAKLK